MLLSWIVSIGIITERLRILSKVNKFLEKTENKLKKKEVEERIKKDW